MVCEIQWVIMANRHTLKIFKQNGFIMTIKDIFVDILINIVLGKHQSD